MSGDTTVELIWFAGALTLGHIPINRIPKRLEF